MQTETACLVPPINLPNFQMKVTQAIILTSHPNLRPKVGVRPLLAGCGRDAEMRSCSSRTVFQSHPPSWTANKQCLLGDNQCKTGCTRCAPNCSFETDHVPLWDEIVLYHVTGTSLQIRLWLSPCSYSEDTKYRHVRERFDVNDSFLNISLLSVQFKVLTNF